MVFGDGGELINNFAECLDVIAHELTHAVMDNISPLDYSDQSGALSEHISDVFGSMVKQMVANEKADAADWLIGEGCLVRGVKGLALRSMKNPGKAYNDPRLVSRTNLWEYSLQQDCMLTQAGTVAGPRSSGGPHVRLREDEGQ